MATEMALVTASKNALQMVVQVVAEQGWYGAGCSPKKCTSNGGASGAWIGLV